MGKSDRPVPFLGENVDIFSRDSKSVLNFAFDDAELEFWKKIIVFAYTSTLGDQQSIPFTQ